MTRFDRLIRTAEIIEDAADNPKIHFDLATWGCSDVKSVSFFMRAAGLDPHNCGTVGCAVGLVVASGEFAKDGLTSTDPYSFVPLYQGYASWSAVQEFYQLPNLEDCYQFFHKSFYNGEARGRVGAFQVAARIREYVAQHRPTPTAVVTEKVLELA